MDSFFIGAQYYRAPTPEPSCWEEDLRKMALLGFDSVKFWVQWRYVHREEDRFIFDDIDRLMELAEQNGLRVTLNVIFDVIPVWIFRRYPEAMLTFPDGAREFPKVYSARQLGGTPGCCLNHPAVKAERMKFLAAVVRRYAAHPALDLWDIWNEPEQNMLRRQPSLSTLTCYCNVCTDRFRKEWLPAKYGTIETLNRVWGRVYADFDEVEIPYATDTFIDFMDYRKYMLDTMQEEAALRIRTVKQYDSVHPASLHVVPDALQIFNPVTCANDFALAEICDIFAGTAGNGIYANLLTSAARGKMTYNAESHLNYGSLRNHQRILTEKDLFRDFILQIGSDLKGVMFWQYRSEALGMEAPAWGFVNPDGSERPFSSSLQKFVGKIRPYGKRIMNSHREAAKIAIWKSTENELFHFCTGDPRWAENFFAGIENYAEVCSRNGYRYRFIDSGMLSSLRTDEVRLLFMPSCYALTQEEASGIAAWVNAGGMLCCEAHLGGYDLTNGRHSAVMPGFGLAASWKIREILTTSSIHISAGSQNADEMGNDDFKKAVKLYGASGGLYYPILLNDGKILTGCDRVAFLQAEDGEVLGACGGNPIVVKQDCGSGSIVYCGTSLGRGASAGSEAFLNFEQFILKRIQESGIQPVMKFSAEIPGSVEISLLCSATGSKDVIVIDNHSPEPCKIQLSHTGIYKGLFHGFILDFNRNTCFDLPGDFTDLFV